MAEMMADEAVEENVDDICKKIVATIGVVDKHRDLLAKSSMLGKHNTIIVHLLDCISKRLKKIVEERINE